MTLHEIADLSERHSALAESVLDLKEIFTKAALAAWLKTKAPDEPYEYGSNEDCLLAQYLKANGLQSVSIGGWGSCHWVENGERIEFSWPEAAKAARGAYNHDTGNFEGRTFGQALARLESLS